LEKYYSNQRRRGPRRAFKGFALEQKSPAAISAKTFKKRPKNFHSTVTTTEGQCLVKICGGCSEIRNPGKWARIRELFYKGLIASGVEFCGVIPQAHL
jgi:hypothetical protein